MRHTDQFWSLNGHGAQSNKHFSLLMLRSILLSRLSYSNHSDLVHKDQLWFLDETREHYIKRSLLLLYLIPIKISLFSVETCKKNWKSLRKGYIGFTTRGKKQVKKWPYADYLTFLNDYRNPATGASTQEYNNVPVDVIKLQLIEEVKKRPVIYIKSHMGCDNRNIEWELLSIAMNVDGK